MTQPLVRLRGAAFGYRGVPVVSGVDLEIAPGDFAGIVGPNGSGKSTLFRGILGLLQPMEGTVESGDAAFGYVPQRDELDPVFPLSVQEVVHLGSYGRLRGLHRLGRAERAAALECLREVGLADRAKHRYASLSGGQRQRVLIARALLMRPNVLLLDEPTTGVDAATREAILELLVRRNGEQELAVLFVTHDPGMLRGVVREILHVAEGGVEHRPALDLAPIPRP